MTFETKPTPRNSTCPVCGEAETLTLAVDVIETKFYQLVPSDSELIEPAATQYEGSEYEQVHSTEDPAVRLFCNACGEYFAVPEEWGEVTSPAF